MLYKLYSENIFLCLNWITLLRSCFFSYEWHRIPIWNLSYVKTDLKHSTSTRNKLWRLRRNQTKTQYEGRWQSEYIYWSRLKHKFWLGEQAVKDVLRSAVRGWLLGESLTKKNGVWQKNLIINNKTCLSLHQIGQI